MRVLVTGASGFVGSYVTELMVERGESVAIIRRATSDLWRIRELLPRVTQIVGDLTALDEIRGEVADFAPDTVVHTAWHGVAPNSRDDEEDVRKNLLSSLDLLRLATELGCATWIGLGSQAEYGPKPSAIREDAAPEPTSLYGVTKLCTYLLSRRIAEAHGMRFAWMRLFSSYGPKDNDCWLVPYVIRTLLDGKKPALTPGEQMWDYVHVSDVARAVYAVAVCREASGVFNIGSGQACALRSVIEQIRDLIDPSLPLGFGDVAYRPGQVMHLQADVTRLEAIAGWLPHVELSNGLSETVKWYRGLRAGRLVGGK